MKEKLQKELARLEGEFTKEQSNYQALLRIQKSAEENLFQMQGAIKTLKELLKDDAK